MYSKPCKYCSQTAIFWDDVHKYFVDKPDSGAKHSCPKRVENKQLESDKRLNEMLNDVKQEVSGQISSLQKSTAHNTSLLVEIKAKLDGVLRDG